MVVGFQLGAVAATAGSFVSRLCRLLVGFPPAATRSTDALGRPSGFALDDDYAVSYAYDMYGRFHSVASAASATSAVTFTYSYLPGTDLITGMTASSGFLWTRAYESGRSLITSVENRYGESVISRYDYQNDALGRRTSRADSGTVFAAQPTYGNPATAPMPAYNAYSYNIRSEVTGATRRWGVPGASGDLVLGQQYAYDFDSIGNRITAAEGDTSRSASYTANALNQYTQRTAPDEKDLIGTAPTNVAVTVNATAVTRQSAYWHHALEVDNATDAAYPQVAITAVYNPPGTNDPDVVTSQTGHVFVAKTPEQFTYDDDGNLTQDGRFDYTWNGENRLIKAETRDDLPVDVPCVTVEYAYDHQGRMVWKQVSTNAVIVSTRTLIWDGYNIIADARAACTNWFVWGLDLSGSLQGAGGVGGLLAEIQDGVPYFAAYDANGNVTDYLSADGTIAAHYEYSPFGEIVVQSGDMADSFTHRFSTKPWCGVTGLSEYLFRKYSPGLGRWLSRDPIGEVNAGLYPFCANSTLTSVDTMGLWGRSGHQEMVEAAAHDLDIPECIVSDIVSGVRGADTWHNPVLPWVGIITEPMPDLHTDDPATPDDDRLTTAQSLISEAKELFRKSCEKGSADQREEALRKLGWALHAIQDFYAHGSLPRGSRHPDWFDDTAVSPLPGSILPSEEYFRNQEGALYPWANDRSAAAVGATWDALFGFFSPDQACECGCQ